MAITKNQTRMVREYSLERKQDWCLVRVEKPKAVLSLGQLARLWLLGNRQFQLTEDIPNYPKPYPAM